LVKNADWILGLWKQGTLPSEDAREKEKVFSKQVEVDSNLRNAQRKTVLGTAWWAKVSSPVEAVGACVDLSETGAQLFFEGNLDFKIGEELLLSLRPAKVVTLDDLDLLMELKSRVMWIDVGARKLGVQFLDLSSDRAEKLKHLLERLSNA
jgi:Tfp pilus assembly protein PilZ